MKKILLLILSVILVISLIGSCFIFSSCPKKKVTEIDGKAPEEALIMAIQRLEEVERYQTVKSMKFKNKLFGVPFYSVNLENMEISITDGKNMSVEYPEEARKKMEQEDMLMTDAHKAVFVDGIYYLKDSYGKYKTETSEPPISDSDYELAIMKILESHKYEVPCYLDKNGYVFEIELKGEAIFSEDDEETELIKIYLSEDGYIQKIHSTVKYSSYLILSTVLIAEIDYTYDGLPPVTAPEDADSYEYVDSYYLQ